MDWSQQTLVSTCALGSQSAMFHQKYCLLIVSLKVPAAAIASRKAEESWYSNCNSWIAPSWVSLNGVIHLGCTIGHGFQLNIPKAHVRCNASSGLGPHTRVTIISLIPIKFLNQYYPELLQSLYSELQDIYLKITGSRFFDFALKGAKLYF